MKTFSQCAFLALELLFVFPQSNADAQKTVPTEVLVVLAKEEAGTIDKQLLTLPALRRAPFNAFRSMKILSRPILNLKKGKDAVIDLPNGRRVKLTLMRVMPDGRYRMKISINRPSKTDYLPLLQVIASPGDPFFVAGQAHNGGTLVIGIRVDPDAKRPKKRKN